MPDEANTDEPTSPGEISGQVAPYESALSAALVKLTSEVLIFLLAYMILVIGLTVFAGAMAVQLRGLLYVIPILGVVAYAWLRQREISRQARRQGVRVRSLFTSDAAKVFGAYGAVESMPDVTVRSGVARGQATVAGIYNDPGADVPQELREIYQRLDRSGRIALLADAERLLERQQDPDA